MKYVQNLVVEAPFEQSCERLLEAFRQQGFGVLTTVDVQDVMHQKLQKELPPYRIYGICNPSLADRAIDLNPEVGVMLPCSVVVRWDQGHSQVHVLSPRVITELAPDGEMEQIMGEADQRIEAALATIKARG